MFFFLKGDNLKFKQILDKLYFFLLILGKKAFYRVAKTFLSIQKNCISIWNTIHKFNFFKYSNTYLKYFF